MAHEAPQKMKEGRQMAYLTTTHTAETRLTDRISDLIAQFRTARARRRTFNETRRELSALSPRELEDIGITRSMITRVAMEAAQGAH
jgi:uncharacterized protein YjiS (DUF1127 family)